MNKLVPTTSFCGRTRNLEFTITIRLGLMPENDDETVEDVESDADVSEDAVGRHLQNHLNGEQGTEEQVAVLDDQRQQHRLQPNKDKRTQVVRLLSDQRINNGRHRRAVKR